MEQKDVFRFCYGPRRSGRTTKLVNYLAQAFLKQEKVVVICATWKDGEYIIKRVMERIHEYNIIPNSEINYCISHIRDTKTGAFIKIAINDTSFIDRLRGYTINEFIVSDALYDMATYRDSELLHKNLSMASYMLREPIVTSAQRSKKYGLYESVHFPPVFIRQEDNKVLSLKDVENLLNERY